MMVKRLSVTKCLDKLGICPDTVIKGVIWIG